MSLSTQDLFCALRAETNEQKRLELRNRLVELHYPLVAIVALAVCKKWMRVGSYYADLTGEGALGLIRAVEKFDPARGFPFDEFARVVIAAQMNQFMRDKADFYPAGVKGRGVTPVGDDETGALDGSDTQAARAFEEFELRDAIERAFEAVEASLESERARAAWARGKRAIEMKYFEGAQTCEIAREFGVSSSAICNLIERAHALLRPHLSDIYP